MPSICFFFIFSLFFSSNAQASEDWLAKSRNLKLSALEQWSDLLHYRPNFIGQVRSQLKGKSFFLSKTGHYDLTSELEATLKQLLSFENLNEEHAVCRFPARKKWLQKHLEIPEVLFPKPNCKLYDFYRERMRSVSISAVFSSYYADSPSSAFGHTLFKLNKKATGGNELLDWGIGYAGEVDTSNALVYIYKGLSGGFKGSFSSVPYYMKVREYNDFESRDIWSYELDLTPEELDFLLDHIWEVGDSYFDYYFLTQNCGFHMLTVLQAAVPRLKLVDKVPFWVIPADALKAIASTPGLVKKIQFRPSVFAQLDSNYLNLSAEEKLHLTQNPVFSPSFINEPSLTSESKARLLDHYLLQFDYVHAKEISKEDEAILSQRHELLSARAQMPTIELNQGEMPANKRPDLSHPSARFTVFGRNLKSQQNSDQVISLDMRFALHDALDPIKGYPEFSTIEMFRFGGEHSKERQSLDFTKFQFLNIESLTPITALRKKRSWGSTVEWDRRRDPFCFDCKAVSLRYGTGYAVFGLDETQVLSAMAYVRPMHVEELSEKNEVLFEPRLSWLKQGDKLSWRLNLGLMYRALREQKTWADVSLENRIHFKNKTYVSIFGQKIGDIEEVNLGYGLFF